MSHKVLKLLIHISINLVLHIIDGLEDKIYLVVTHVDIGQGRCDRCTVLQLAHAL